MWNSETRLDKYVKQLMDKVLAFEEKVLILIEKYQ